MMELPDDMKEYLAKLNSEKEYLCAAYLAETGLKPSEVKIIQHTNQGGMSYYLQRKDWVDDVETPAMNDMRSRIAELERKLSVAKEALKDLYMNTSTSLPYDEYDDAAWYRIQLHGVIGRAAKAHKELADE